MKPLPANPSRKPRKSEPFLPVWGWWVIVGFILVILLFIFGITGLLTSAGHAVALHLTKILLLIFCITVVGGFIVLLNSSRGEAKSATRDKLLAMLAVLLILFSVGVSGYFTNKSENNNDSDDRSAKHATPDRDAYENMWRSFVLDPKGTKKMAIEGAEFARTCDAHSAVPMRNVRAMYAYAVMLSEGYGFPRNKDESLNWILKAGVAGRISMDGKDREVNDRLTEYDATTGGAILKKQIEELRRGGDE